MSFIEKAVEALDNDGVILVPTDTHFAIAASPNSSKAMQKLIHFKDSLGITDITFCFSELKQVWPWIDINLLQQQKIDLLGNKFWPGPLKMSLKGRKSTLKNLPGIEVLSVVCIKNFLVNKIITVQGAPLVVVPAFSDGVTESLVSFTRAREHFGNKVDLVVPSNNKRFCSCATTHISILDDTIRIIRQGDLDITDYL